MSFRLSGGTHCLQEDTPGAISLPPLPSTIAAHTIDYQCKKSRGEQATKCPFAIRGAPVSWYKPMVHSKFCGCLCRNIHVYTSALH